MVRMTGGPDIAGVRLAGGSFWDAHRAIRHFMTSHRGNVVMSLDS